MRGAQRPRVESHPSTAVSSSGDEVIAFAESVGLHLDDWQQYVLRRWLGETPEGRWSAYEIALIVPRQNGKTLIIVVLVLAALFVFGEELVLCTSHQLKTSKETRLDITAVCKANEFLDRQVAAYRTQTGSEALELKDGRRCLYTARSTHSGRGFKKVDRLILDEAYDLTLDEMAALIPTTAAARDPQIVYASSAGMASSTVLHDLRERGLVGGSKRLSYLEWSAPDNADWDDESMWALANPALGASRASGLTVDFVLGEHAALQGRFGQERLGIWDDPTHAGVISAEDWRACLDPTSRIEGPPRFAVDVRPDRSAAAIGAAGRRADGLWHVETVDAQSGTSWVVPRLVQLLERWGSAPVGIDPGGPAAPLMTAMLAAGLAVAATSTQEMTQASGLFFDRVTDRSLRHVPQASLDAAVVAGQRKWLGDKWLWARKESVDVTPLLACSVALFVAQQAAVERPRTNKAAFY